MRLRSFRLIRKGKALIAASDAAAAAARARLRAQLGRPLAVDGAAADGAAAVEKQRSGDDADGDGSTTCGGEGDAEGPARAPESGWSRGEVLELLCRHVGLAEAYQWVHVNDLR